MQDALTDRAGEVGVDRKTGDPRKPLAGENKRPTVSILTWHPRVDEDVLKLAGAPAADRPHAQAGPPKSHLQLKAGAEVGCLAVVAARAAPDLEASRLARSGLRRHDLHEVPHDTETQASRNIDAPAATTRSGEPQHRFQVGAREAGLGAPRACIQDRKSTRLNSSH